MIKPAEPRPVLITGVAGFIGAYLAESLLKDSLPVVGIDNLNDYYDIGLKCARLNKLELYQQFVFIPGDIGMDFPVIERPGVGPEGSGRETCRIKKTRRVGILKSIPDSHRMFKPPFKNNDCIP